MMESGTLDFSFSGLKTAVLYLTKRLSEKGVRFNGTDPASAAIQKGICREVEDAITEVVISKMRAAMERYAVETLVIGGGVIANTNIRQALEKLASDCSVRLLLPRTDHSTDNGLMIAIAGYFNRDKSVGADVALKANGTLALGPRD